MNFDHNIELNTTINGKVKTYCGRCNTETWHAVLTNVFLKGSEEIENGRHSISWSDDYQIVMCRGCEYVSYITTSWFSENCTPDDSGYTYLKYPERKTKETLIYHNVPLFANLNEIG